MLRIFRSCPIKNERPSGYREKLSIQHYIDLFTINRIITSSSMEAPSQLRPHDYLVTNQQLLLLQDFMVFLQIDGLVMLIEIFVSEPPTAQSACNRIPSLLLSRLGSPSPSYFNNKCTSRGGGRKDGRINDRNRVRTLRQG